MLLQSSDFFGTRPSQEVCVCRLVQVIWRQSLTTCGSYCWAIGGTYWSIWSVLNRWALSLLLDERLQMSYSRRMKEMETLCEVVSSFTVCCFINILCSFCSDSQREEWKCPDFLFFYFWSPEARVQQNHSRSHSLLWSMNLTINLCCFEWLEETLSAEKTHTDQENVSSTVCRIVRKLIAVRQEH